MAWKIFYQLFWMTLTGGCALFGVSSFSVGAAPHPEPVVFRSQLS
jgi:hypothetical protein